MKKVVLSVIFSLLCAGLFAAGQKEPVEKRIFLYGETHGVTAIYEYELAKWQEYYAEGMRHLFVESSYSQAMLLNEWMKAENDNLLMLVYQSLQGTAAHTEDFPAFYRAIKETCPETVFHGTDIEHQFNTTGQYYLLLLEVRGQLDSEDWQIVLENGLIAQTFYGAENGKEDWSSREKAMISNFEREFDKLPENEKIMGIYGSAHTIIGAKDMSGKIGNMATQLKNYYKKQGDIIESYDISWLEKEIAPQRTDEFEINGKIYTAEYFGEQDLTPYFEQLKSRKFWRIEGAFDDFKKFKSSDNYLPFNNYPMNIKEKDILRIEYLMSDDSISVEYYRNDGRFYDNVPSTNQVIIK